MFKVYLIEFPYNFNPRIMAFKNEKKAMEICDSFNRQRGASKNSLYVTELNIYEDKDINIVEELS